MATPAYNENKIRELITAGLAKCSSGRTRCQTLLARAEVAPASVEEDDDDDNDDDEDEELAAERDAISDLILGAISKRKIKLHVQNFAAKERVLPLEHLYQSK